MLIYKKVKQDQRRHQHLYHSTFCQRQNWVKLVPETIQQLNTHYQHCPYCRTSRASCNKEWLDTL